MEDTELIRFCPQADGWTDGQTRWNQYTPFQLHWSRGIMRCNYLSMHQIYDSHEMQVKAGRYSLPNSTIHIQLTSLGLHIITHVIQLTFPISASWIIADPAVHNLMLLWCNIQHSFQGAISTSSTTSSHRILQSQGWFQGCAQPMRDINRK